MQKDIFIEAFRHQFLPFFNEITLPAMQAFGDFHLMNPMLMAIAGAFAAVFVLFRFGKIIAMIWRLKEPERAEAVSKRFEKYAFVLMLLVSTPFGFAIAFAAGVLGSPSKFALPLALVGLATPYVLEYL